MCSTHHDPHVASKIFEKTDVNSAEYNVRSDCHEDDTRTSVKPLSPSTFDKENPPPESTASPECDNTAECAAEGFLIIPIFRLHTAVWSELMSPFFGTRTGNLGQIFGQLQQLREYFICVHCKKLVPSIYDSTAVPSDQCASFHLRCADCSGNEIKDACRKHYSPVGGCDADLLNSLRTLIESYKTLCRFVLRGAECEEALEKELDVDPTFDALTFLDYLIEGAIASKEVLHQNSNESSDIIESGEGDNSSTTNTSDTEEEREQFATRYISRNSPCLDEVITNPVVTNFHVDTSTATILHSATDVLWPNPSEVVQYATGHAGFAHSTKLVVPVIHPFSLPDPVVVSSSASMPSPDGLISPFISEESLPSSDNITGVSKDKLLKKGCRCGNASLAPGKLTCCGQRCPCYAAKKICNGCRCKGCRNPHLADGRKVLSGVGRTQTISAIACSNISLTSGSNTSTVQSIPDVHTTFAPGFPLNSVAAFTTYPIPVHVPVSIVGIAPLIQNSNIQFNGTNLGT